MPKKECNLCGELYDIGEYHKHQCVEELPVRSLSEVDTHEVLTEVGAGYRSLHDVLIQALDQAQSGKGHERHANGKPFDQQPCMAISEMVGDGFCTGQAIKKLQESMRLDTDAAIRERLGAIVYIAASIIRMQKEMDSESLTDWGKRTGALLKEAVEGDKSC